MRSSEFISQELEENLKQWFKEKWVRFGPDGKIRGDCARGDDSEGKPKCLPQSKAHSLGKKGRASAASRKRREDPNPERSGRAINVNTKKKTNEQELDEACWKGYHKEGNKKMFGKTYPNCVKNTNEELDIEEDSENFNGINFLLQKDDDEIFVKASTGSRELGHVLFVIDGDYLMPQDLEVEERYRGQGIAQTMYDFVKSKGYKIRRSGQQTDAGAGFWDKHRPEQNVWEEQHSESCPHCGGEMISEELMNEKQDACYYKVKSRYKVWPSAYASGALVQCRKKGAANWGNGGKSNESIEEGKERCAQCGMTGCTCAPGSCKCKPIAGWIPNKGFKKAVEENEGHCDACDRAMSQCVCNDEQLDEKWSQKYKSSINCSNPKGFSQRAHCAGKQKNEETEMSENYNGEYDDEAGMADNNLETLKRAVEGIDSVIDAGDNLPEWCQEKIAVAKSMLVAVWDYMESEEQRGEDSDAESDELVRVLELSGMGFLESMTPEQQFDIIEEMVEQLAEQHGVDAEMIWEDFESVEDTELFETAAWRRKEGKSKSGGLNAKGVASYRRENPGSKLQTAVTTKPSKLKPGSKAAKRRKSFCARMSGVKGPMKKPNGKPTRKALALRKWNC